MCTTPTKEDLLERVKTLKNDCSASHQTFLGILQEIRDVSFDPKLGPRLQCRIAEFIKEWEGYCSVGNIRPAIIREELMIIYQYRPIFASYGDPVISQRQQRDPLEVPVTA